MDFTLPSSQEKIKQLLEGRSINCLLSDIAPNASGIRQLDQENIMNLCNSVLDFAIPLSAPGASLLVKVWDNGDVNKFLKRLNEYYDTVKTIKPEASRGDSAEKFILARNFNRNK